MPIQKWLLKVTHVAEYEITHAADRAGLAAAFQTPVNETVLLEHTSLLGMHDGERFKVMTRPLQES